MNYETLDEQRAREARAILSTFRSGDKVRVVKSEQDRLPLGKVLTVRDASPEDGRMIRLEEVEGSWYASRFELVMP